MFNAAARDIVVNEKRAGTNHARPRVSAPDDTAARQLRVALGSVYRALSGDRSVVFRPKKRKGPSAAVRALSMARGATRYSIYLHAGLCSPFWFGLVSFFVLLRLLQPLRTVSSACRRCCAVSVGQPISQPASQPATSAGGRLCAVALALHAAFLFYACVVVLVVVVCCPYIRWTHHSPPVLTSGSCLDLSLSQCLVVTAVHPSPPRPARKLLLS